MSAALTSQLEDLRLSAEEQTRKLMHDIQAKEKSISMSVDKILHQINKSIGDISNYQPSTVYIKGTGSVLETIIISKNQFFAALDMTYKILLPFLRDEHFANTKKRFIDAYEKSKRDFENFFYNINDLATFLHSILGKLKMKTEIVDTLLVRKKRKRKKYILDSMPWPPPIGTSYSETEWKGIVEIINKINLPEFYYGDNFLTTDDFNNIYEEFTTYKLKSLLFNSQLSVFTDRLQANFKTTRQILLSFFEMDTISVMDEYIEDVRKDLKKIRIKPRDWEGNPFDLLKEEENFNFEQFTINFGSLDNILKVYEPVKILNALYTIGVHWAKIKKNIMDLISDREFMKNEIDTTAKLKMMKPSSSERKSVRDLYVNIAIQKTKMITFFNSLYPNIYDSMRPYLKVQRDMNRPDFVRPSPSHFNSIEQIQSTSDLFDYQILMGLNIYFEDSKIGNSHLNFILLETGMGKSYIMFLHALVCAIDFGEPVFVFCSNNVVDMFKQCVRFLREVAFMEENDIYDRVVCFDDPTSENKTRLQIQSRDLQYNLDKLKSISQNITSYIENNINVDFDKHIIQYFHNTNWKPKFGHKPRAQETIELLKSQHLSPEELSKTIDSISEFKDDDAIINTCIATVIERIPMCPNMSIADIATDIFETLDSFSIQDGSIDGMNWLLHLYCVLRNTGSYVVEVEDNMETDELVAFQAKETYTLSGLYMFPKEFKLENTHIDRLNRKLIQSFKEGKLDVINQVCKNIRGSPIESHVTSFQTHINTMYADSDYIKTFKMEHKDLNILNQHSEIVKRLGQAITLDKSKVDSYLDHARKIIFRTYTSIWETSYSEYINHFTPRMCIFDEADAFEHHHMINWAKTANIEYILGLSATINQSIESIFNQKITCLPNVLYYKNEHTNELESVETQQFFEKYYNIPVVLRPTNEYETIIDPVYIPVDNIQPKFIVEQAFAEYQSNQQYDEYERSILVFVKDESILDDIARYIYDIDNSILKENSTNSNLFQIEKLLLATIKSGDIGMRDRILEIVQNGKRNKNHRWEKTSILYDSILFISDTFSRGFDFINFRSLLKFGNFDASQLKQMNGRPRRINSQPNLKMKGVQYKWFIEKSHENEAYIARTSYNEFEMSKSMLGQKNPLIILLCFWFGAPFNMDVINRILQDNGYKGAFHNIIGSLLRYI